MFYRSLTLSLLSASPLFSISIVPNYLDGASEGFNDPALGADRRTAFEFALGLWGNALQESYVGETVTVDAEFNSLGGSSTGATLGFAGPQNSASVSAGNNPLPGTPSNVFFSGALRNHLSGSDQSAGNEIAATFNSDVDGSVALGSTTFYYGTDNNGPSGTTDFVSTALHEIGHGLGWSGSLDLNPSNMITDGEYLNGSRISAFDFWVQRTSDGQRLENLSTGDRLAAATGDNISWDGPIGTAANGGTSPDLFAPSTAQPGSSYSHLDEGDFPTELLSPTATAGTGHNLSPLTLAILEDQGWSIAVIVPEPSSTLYLAGCLLLAVGRRRRS